MSELPYRPGPAICSCAMHKAARPKEGAWFCAAHGNVLSDPVPAPPVDELVGEAERKLDQILQSKVWIHRDGKTTFLDSIHNYLSDEQNAFLRRLVAALRSRAAPGEDARRLAEAVYHSPTYARLDEQGNGLRAICDALRAPPREPAKAEQEKTEGPCKCGLRQLRAHEGGHSWYWQLHTREKCTLELPNARCWCGLLRSEHLEGHAAHPSEDEAREAYSQMTDDQKRNEMRWMQDALRYRFLKEGSKRLEWRDGRWCVVDVVRGKIAEGHSWDSAIDAAMSASAKEKGDE